MYSLYKYFAGKEHKLLYLFLEITRRCNLSCRHCGSDCDSSWRGKTLSKKSWFSIVDYFSAHYSPELLFVITGGEPLCADFLPELGRRINRRGRNWGLVTNGMDATPDRIKELEQAGASSITISLDGLEPQHNWLRNSKQAFTKVRSAMECIGRSSFAFKDVVTCVHPANLESLDAIGKIVIDSGMNSWRLFRIFPSGRAKHADNLALSFEQTREMVDWIKKNRDFYGKAGVDCSLSCEGYLPINIDRMVRNEPFFCRSGINMASILVDGTITGCSNNPSAMAQGSIESDDFVKVWEEGFKFYRNKKLHAKGACRTCGQFRHCQGGSMHLWEDTESGPAFCYFKNIHED